MDNITKLEREKEFVWNTLLGFSSISIINLLGLASYYLFSKNWILLMLLTINILIILKSLQLMNRAKKKYGVK